MDRPAKQIALVSYKAASDLAGKAAFWAVLIVAARRLTTEAFGLFSLASTLGWMLSVATDFGLQIHLAREVARRPAHIVGILRPLLRLRIQLATGAMAASMLLTLFWLPLHDAVPFLLVVLAYLAGSLVEFLNHVYRSLSRSDLESTLNLVQRIATLIAALVLLTLAPRFGMLALALVIPPIVVFACSLGLVARLGRRADPPAAAMYSPGLSRAAWMHDVFPIGAGIVLSSLYFRIDVFLVRYWQGVEEVARYNAVFRLVEALRLFPSALLAIMLPVVFQRRDAGIVWRMSVGLAAFGVAVALALYGHAPRIVTLAYGARYLPAAPAFQVLLLAFPLLSLNYGLTHQIIGWDGQRDYALICGLALVANLAMNAVLIPRFGIGGAAWSTLGTECLISVACLVALVAGRRRAALRGLDPAPRKESG